MPHIHGLSCAQCKAAITADGVTCAACSAPHHWPCYAGPGHCASCQAAKPPVPFGVAPMARGAQAWAVAASGVAVLAAAAVAITAMGLVRSQPEPVMPKAVVAAPAPTPAPRFSFHALKEQVPGVSLEGLIGHVEEDSAATSTTPCWDCTRRPTPAGGCTSPRAGRCWGSTRPTSSAPPTPSMRRRSLGRCGRCGARL